MNSSTEFWNELNGPFGGKVNDMVSLSAGVMLASTDHGLYRSINSGDSWKRVPIASDDEFSDLEIDPTSSGKKVFVGSNKGHVYVSIDAGVTWTLLTTHTGTTWRIKKIKVANMGTTIYLADSMGSVLKSTDDGNSFSTFASFSDTFIKDLDLDEKNNVYVATDGQGLKVSDGTADFKTPSSGSITSTSTVYALAIKSSTEIYCLSVDGVHKSVNGSAEFELSNSGLPGFFVGGSIKLDVSGNLFVCYKRRVYISTAESAGAEWNLLDSCPGVGINLLEASHFMNSKLFYLTSDEVGIIKYSSGTWSIVSEGIRARNQSDSKLIEFNHQLMMTGSTYGYYTSSNNGAMWGLNNDGVSGRSLKGFIKLNDNAVLAYGLGVIRLAENSSDWALQSDHYFANEIVTSNGINLFSFETSTSSDEIILLTSIDQGITWTNQPLIGLPGTPLKIQVDAKNNLYFLVNSQIWKLPVDEKSATKLSSLTAPDIQDFKVVGNSILVLNEGVLYTSSDHGNTFVSKDVTNSATALWVHDDKTIFLGTATNNLYLSKDRGASWINQPLPETKDLITHVYVSNEGFVYAVTSNSVFSSNHKWV